MEIWKQMDEGYILYEVSSDGNVRNMQTKKILKKRKDGNGYASVFLKDKKSKLNKWVKVSDLEAYYIYNHTPF